jgi:hypothetical protein
LHYITFLCFLSNSGVEWDDRFHPDAGHRRSTALLAPGTGGASDLTPPQNEIQWSQRQSIIDFRQKHLSARRDST